MAHANRSWTVKDGPSLAELAASLMTGGEYLVEFTLADRARAGYRTLMMCGIVGMELAGNTARWTLLLRGASIVGDATNWPLDDCPSSGKLLRGTYTFEPGQRRTGVFEEVPAVRATESRGTQCKHCGMGESAHFSVAGAPLTCANFTPMN